MFLLSLLIKDAFVVHSVSLKIIEVCSRLKLLSRTCSHLQSGNFDHLFVSSCVMDITLITCLYLLVSYCQGGEAASPLKLVSQTHCLWRLFVSRGSCVVVSFCVLLSRGSCVIH